MIRKQLIIQNSRTIFQVKPPRHNVTIRDVEDIKNATRYLPPNLRRDIFYANGIDYDRVEKYYNYVRDLEKSWYINEEGKKVTHFRLLCLGRLLKVFLLMLFDLL